MMEIRVYYVLLKQSGVNCIFRPSIEFNKDAPALSAE